jgi:hypothetical protein
MAASTDMETVMKQTQEVLTIVSIKRLKSSRNGNPNYLATFADGRSARTKADAYVGYDVQNSEYQGTPVLVTFEDDRISRVNTLGEVAK